MVTDKNFTELIPAFALDCLDEEEKALVSEHLATCVDCHTELLSFQSVTDQLALAAPDAAPPADLKRRLMERIQPAHPPTVIDLQPSWWEQLTRLWRRVTPVWGALSLILILALAASNLLLWRQVREPGVRAGTMQVVTLMGTNAAPNATGTIVVSLDGEHGTLVVDGLPSLDETQQYQLWLIKDGQRTSGGVFSVNSRGYGALWVSSQEPLSSYPAFGITIEPAGGSPGPTGDKVLGGSL